MIPGACLRHLRKRFVWQSTIAALALSCATSIVLRPQPAAAAPGDCFSDPTDGYTDYKTIDLRVNVSSLESIPTATGTEARLAAQLAADVWNEQANAHPFRYLGTTTLTDLPELAVDCRDQGKDYTIIVGVSDTGSGGASAQRRCYENGKPTQFRIVIDSASLFTVGAPASGRRDLASLIAHEFSHVMGFVHPQNLSGEAAVINSIAILDDGHTKKRDLYPV